VRRRLVAALVAALAASPAGCSSPASPVSPAASAPPAPMGAAPSPSALLAGCLDPTQARTLPVPGVLAAALGAGTRAVVLSEQSDQDLCGWLPLVPQLRAAGYEVVLWDYGTGTPTDELRDVITAVRAAGAQQVALVGASKGAKASLVTAATPGPPVRGVVALSAESILQPSIDVARYVANLTCPVLFVTATGDGYGAADAGREFVRVAASKDKRLLTVDGEEHGTALLTGTHAATVNSALLAFLARVLR
jgi:pimeloyl-ACP methyl ester carboxylesterase